MIYVEDDGAVNIIKTYYYDTGDHNHNKDINIKIYALRKMQDKYSLDVFKDITNFSDCTL